MLNFSEANGFGWTAWPLTPLNWPFLYGISHLSQESIIKPPAEVKSLKIDEDEDIGEEEVAFENRYYF